MTQPVRELPREIGVVGLSANIINIMIGAGIFVLPAIIAGGLGTSSYLAYLFCAVLIGLVMLCFAEVGSKIAAPGGPYAYIEAAFGRYFGFITAFLFIISAIASDAAVANAIISMMVPIIPVLGSPWIQFMFYLVVFGGLAYINIIGVKSSVTFVKMVTLSKLIPLTILAFASWTRVSFDNLAIESSPPFEDIGQMALILFFAFQGAETGLSVSGEVKNPQKTVPKSILISISSVLMIYLLIQAVSLGVLGEDLATYKENPLAQVASRLVGPIGFTLLTIGAAVSMFGNLSSEALSVPRVLYGAAKNRLIPLKWLAMIHPRYATPHIAIIVYLSLGFILCFAGGFEQLAIISSSTILLLYLGVSLAVIKLRKNHAETLSGSFRIPGGWTVPLLSCSTIIWFLSHLSDIEMLSMIIILAICSALYFVLKHTGGISDEKIG